MLEVESRLAHNDYDSIAPAYAAYTDNNVWNADYERPASLALVGTVAGLRVLDAGCGAGAHSAALLERGAIVTGVLDHRLPRRNTPFAKVVSTASPPGWRFCLPLVRAPHRSWTCIYHLSTPRHGPSFTRTAD